MWKGLGGRGTGEGRGRAMRRMMGSAVGSATLVQGPCRPRAERNGVRPERPCGPSRAGSSVRTVRTRAESRNTRQQPAARVISPGRAFFPGLDCGARPTATSPDGSKRRRSLPSGDHAAAVMPGLGFARRRKRASSSPWRSTTGRPSGSHTASQDASGESDGGNRGLLRFDGHPLCRGGRGTGNVAAGTIRRPFRGTASLRRPRPRQDGPVGENRMEPPPASYSRGRAVLQVKQQHRSLRDAPRQPGSRGPSTYCHRLRSTPLRRNSTFPSASQTRISPFDFPSCPSTISSPSTHFV